MLVSLFLELGGSCNAQRPVWRTPAPVMARAALSEGLGQDPTGGRDVERILGFQSRRKGEDSRHGPGVSITDS